MTASRQTRSIVVVGADGVEQVAGGERLELAAPEVVDDQAMEDGPQVVAEPALVVVGPGELVGQQLGPELLEDLVGEVLVAELQPEVALDGVVIAADQLAASPPGRPGPGMWALRIVVQLVSRSVRWSPDAGLVPSLGISMVLCSMSAAPLHAATPRRSALAIAEPSHNAGTSPFHVKPSRAGMA